MPDRELTIRFVGKEAGLKKSASDGAAALGSLRRAADEAKVSASALDRVFIGFLEGLGRKGLDLAIASVQQLGQAIKNTVGEALNQSAAFDEARAAAATLTDDTDGLIKALQGAQDRLGNQVTTAELLTASYDILSSGFTDSADAAAIAEAAARGALAGFSDTGTTADALTTIVNSYAQMGTTAQDAEQIIDQLVKTQDLGKITLGEYADQLGRAASIAATAGVSFEEFSGAIATATAKGVPADSAVSGTRQAIINLLKPTADAAALLEQFGIQNSAAALRSGGLVGVLEKLRDQGATTDQLSKIFSDVDALATVATLAGENLGTFQANIEGIATASGTTDKNLKLLTETINGQKKALEVLTKEGLLEFGMALDPIRAGVLTFANDLLTATTEGSDGLGELQSSGKRLQAVLSENPAAVERLSAALATLANEGVDQLVSLVEAAAEFASSEEDIEGVASAIEDVATVINFAAAGAGLLFNLRDAIQGLIDKAADLPIIGQALNLVLAPLLAVQEFPAALEALGELRSRAERLKDNLLRVRTEFEALGGVKLGAGLKTGSEALGAALGSLKKNADAGKGAIAGVGGAAGGAADDTKDLEEAFKDLETAAKAAQGAAVQAETERLSSLRQVQQGELKSLRQQLEAGAITTEQFTERRTAIEQRFNDDARKATIDRIKAEIAAEQERTKKLEALGGPESEVKIQESKLKTAQLTDSLLSEQIAAEEEAADRILEAREAAQEKAEEAAKAREEAEEEAARARAEAEEAATKAAVEAIAERLRAQENAVQAEVLALARVQQAIEQVNGAYTRQGQLLSAQANLQSTLGDAQQSAFKILIDGAESDKERAKISQRADAARLASLQRSQALELASFDLRQRQLQIENAIAQARLKGSIAENAAAQAAAQANIETLRAEGASAGQVNAAQLGLQASRQQGEALAQQFTATLEESTLLRDVAGIERAALIAQQSDRTLQARAENLSNAEQRLGEGGSRRDRRNVQMERLGLQRDAGMAIQFIGRSEAQSFNQAIAGLEQFAQRIESTGMLSAGPNAALNPLLMPITPATPQQQLGQQRSAPSGPTTFDLVQNNDITINVPDGAANDGTLSQNLEDAVFAGLGRVIERAKQQL